MTPKNLPQKCFLKPNRKVASYYADIINLQTEALVYNFFITDFINDEYTWFSMEKITLLVHSIIRKMSTQFLSISFLLIFIDKNTKFKNILKFIFKTSKTKIDSKLILFYFYSLCSSL